jgi:CSLREA domain-containing protein
MLIRLTLACLVVLGPLMHFGTPTRSAFAISLTVTSTADEPDAVPGNGVCASASGACTLRAAVTEANTLGGSNRITLPAGTFTLTIAGRGEDAAATGDLDVNGGTLEVVGAGVDRTVIDANQLDRVFHLGPTAPTQFSLNGVTIRNGNAVSSPPDPGGNGTDVGGGIRVERNTGLTVEQARFVSNQAGARGGAIGMPTTAGSTAAGVDVSIISRVTDVTMENGTAGVEAGGFFSNRTAVLTRVRVLNNRVTGGLLTGAMAGTERGGGIASSGDLTLNDVVVDSNTMGSGNGGGIGNRGDPVANIFGTLRMTNVTVSNNQSELGGGIANGNGGTMIATNVTISGNRAVDQPGGVVPGNVTAGGIVNLGNATLTNVTIANNRSGVGGGLVTVGPPLGSGAARTTLRATLLANNAGGNCLLPSAALPITRAPTSDGDNISSDGSCSLSGPNDRNNTDPLLESLANNGGFTPTHALRSNSPAVDAVQGGCPPPATDQRGVARPQGARCDIGAFELEAAGAVNDPNNDDEEDEERRRQRTRNNATRGNDDARTEGNVVGVRCVDSDPIPTVTRGFIVEPDMTPYALIGNRDDGVQKVLLIRDAAKLCQSIRVGQYLEAEGEKQSEELFYADDVTIAKR